MSEYEQLKKEILDELIANLRLEVDSGSYARGSENTRTIKLYHKDTILTTADLYLE